MDRVTAGVAFGLGVYFAFQGIKLFWQSRNALKSLLASDETPERLAMMETSLFHSTLVGLGYGIIGILLLILGRLFQLH